VWQIKDLAQLLYSSLLDGVDVRDRLQFWRFYWEPGHRGRLARWFQQLIVIKAGRYHRHNARHQSRLRKAG
jgi:heptose I phosphotransferase